MTDCQRRLHGDTALICRATCPKHDIYPATVRVGFDEEGSREPYQRFPPVSVPSMTEQPCAAKKSWNHPCHD
jgi:hypothetical protein